LVVYGCLFVFEGWPITLVLCGCAAQVVHLTLLNNFPFFSLGSPSFIASVGERLNHFE
jgi:hypothetical protein